MRRALGLLLTGFSTLAGAQQQSFPSEPKWQAVCASTLAQPLSAQQPSGPLRDEALKRCDEMALYYGYANGRGQPDYPAALQCGWWQRAHPQSTVGNMFYGPGVLTMLYANGFGIPRNYDLAIRFACENTWAAPAEMEGRIGHLEQMKTNTTAKQAVAFDLCDDATSGLSMGFCASVQTANAALSRGRNISSLAGKLPSAAQSAFTALQAAEKAFDEARSGNEVDLSGTGRAAFSLEEESKLQDQFLINLQRFGSGDIPAVSKAQAAALERELNTTYKRLQDLPASAWQNGGTITAEGIRTTERTWIGLADAWARFAALAYPELSPERVRAQLIRLRLHQLRSLQPL